MFKIAVVIFRESVEIALLIGVIMAVTKSVVNSRLYIIAGALIGVIGASLFAFFTSMLSVSFGGMGDEIFDSIVMIITVFIIIWAIVWMQGYEYRLKQKLTNLSSKIIDGYTSHFMLTLLISSVILREGTEISLIVYSISSSESHDINDYLYGLGIGAFSGLLVGIIMYLGLTKFSGKYLFKFSSMLLLLIAAGIASEAAAKLTSSGIIMVLSDQVWDSSWLVEDNSAIGRFLNVISGYTAKPNALQIIFYTFTIVMTVIFIKITRIYKNRTIKIRQNND